MCLMSHTVYVLCQDENALLWEEDEYHFMGDLAGFSKDATVVDFRT